MMALCLVEDDQQDGLQARGGRGGVGVGRTVPQLAEGSRFGSWWSVVGALPRDMNQQQKKRSCKLDLHQRQDIAHKI